MIDRRLQDLCLPLSVAAIIPHRPPHDCDHATRLLYYGASMGMSISLTYSTDEHVRQDIYSRQDNLIESWTSHGRVNSLERVEALVVSSQCHLEDTVL